MIGDELRGLVEIAGAGVVAHSLPRLQNVLLVCRRERFDVREQVEEVFVVGQNGAVGRLLHHDLAEPAGVGGRGFAPRHGTFRRVEPREQTVCDVFRLFHVEQGAQYILSPCRCQMNPVARPEVFARFSSADLIL